MTIKEKIVRKTISEVNDRIVEIDRILYANPLSDICQLRIKAQEIMDDNGNDYVKIAKLIKPLERKEKELFKIAKKQNTDSVDLIDEKVKLKSELLDLKSELYWIEHRG